MAGRGQRVPDKKLVTRNNIRTTLSQNQEVTTDFSALLANALRPLMEQMTNLNTKLDNVQKQLNQMDKRTSATEKTLKKMEKQTESINKRVDEAEKERSADKMQIAQLQLNRSMYVLCFHGNPEEKNEDLKELLVAALTPLMDYKQEDLIKEMDVAYRTYPDFIKKNKLPGKIYLKFTKRSTRKLVLKSAMGKSLKIKNEEVKILKDNPFEVRKQRKRYRMLTLTLQKKGIPYRWLFPEGLSFNCQEKKPLFRKRKNLWTKFMDTKNKQKEKNLKPDGEEEEEDESYSQDSTSQTSTSESSESEKGAAALKLQKTKKRRKKIL